MVEFAVNTGIVAPDDPVPAGVARAAELGVGAVEFFDLAGADAAAVRAACEEHGVAVAAVLGSGDAANIDDRDAPAAVNPYDHETVVAALEDALESAAAVDAATLICTVGPDQGGFDRATQRRALEDVLRAVAPTAEAVGVTVAIEPLNPLVDHPGYFLTESQEAFDVVRAVDSERVAVLFDAYHQQITEGDVIRNLTENVDDVGHVHVADNPGRYEPGSGEMAYENILDALEEAGYDGYVGMEFFETSEGTTVEEGVRDTLELG
ncbi:MAG: TIM barrel protein [Haloarculaceae archaeon]